MHTLILMPLEPLTASHKAIIKKGLDTHDGVIVGVQEAPPRSEPEISLLQLRKDIMAGVAKKILICGLSGSGKTWLTRELAPLLDAIHLNNDFIRDGPHAELGWSLEDRIAHAHKVGQWADILIREGHDVIIDMICPTAETRDALDPDYVIFVDTISKSQYADTDALFEPPASDFRVQSQNAGMWARLLAEKLARRLIVISLPQVGDIVNLQAG